ncbi:MAG: RDD family protein [Planctomycetaceae bacterium]|nr:RDD family protein [Planctomycetaceae bacterium]
MPVKVRCSSCSAVLNAPDKARGKTIACPKCQGRIKIPAGDAPAAKQPAKPKAKPKPKHDPDDIFGGMKIDDYDMEHDEEQICPYCAAEMEYDDEDDLIPVCANCGMNIETGEMDAREKKRRARKGPPIEEYWGTVWKESFAFVKQYPMLAVRTGLYIGIFLVISAMSTYMVSFCKGLPTKAFWAVLASVSILGVSGWYWILAKKIVFASIVREEIQSDRIFFDLFDCMSIGLRASFWPGVVLLPLLIPYFFLMIFLVILSPDIANIVASIGSWGICIWLFPIAMCHFTSKYTYKSWILWELLKLCPKNLAGSAYWVIVAGTVMLPIALIAGPTAYFLSDGSDMKTGTNVFFSPVICGEQRFTTWSKDADLKWVPAEEIPEVPADAPFNQLGVTGKLTLAIMSVAELGNAPSSAWYALIKGPMNIMFAFMIYLPITVLAGFPLLFTMKAIGVFGYYHTPTLALVQRVKPNTPATFWVRGLSTFVDFLFMGLTPFVVTANGKALSGAWAGLGLLLTTWLFSPNMLLVVGGLYGLYIWWMYWVIQESSPMRATMGKEGFGLIVIPEDSEQPITMQTATIRWVMRTICLCLLGLPNLMILIDPRKQALHDKASKTVVVWKGDK